MHETIDQETPVIAPGAIVPGDDPLPTDLPADTEAIVGSLSQLGDKLDRLIAATTAQVSPAPSLLFAMPGVHNDFPQTVRVQLQTLVVSISAAATVTVSIGSGVFISFDLASADTRVLPFPRTIPEGTDVSVTVSAGVLRLAYFTGYIEPA